MQAVPRPQALRDQQGEVKYYRKEGGTRVAVRVAKATNAALDHIELDPGIGVTDARKAPWHSSASDMAGGELPAALVLLRTRRPR